MQAYTLLELLREVKSTDHKTSSDAYNRINIEINTKFIEGMVSFLQIPTK
jgi:hypothetical protein